MSDTAPPPPPGPPLWPPNLPHDSLKVNIIVSSAICWAIAACFVGLRFYTRGAIIRVLSSSDWSILAALVFAAATCAGIIEQAVHGAGQHVWDLDPTDTASAIAWGRAAWYGVLFYNLSLCFSKVSILLLYIHLFSFKWARTAGQVLLAIVILTNIYMALVAFTACIPLQAYWDFTLQKQYCHPQSFWWSSTGMHMVTDFLIFLLPMPVVWSIQLPRRQKLILSGVFGFGFLVCFISILRLIQLLRAQTDPDFTYVAAELSYLTAVEINGAIVCACVMTLKPLLVKFFPRILGSRSRDLRSSRSGSNAYRAGTDTLVGGPPTIGSRPSKARLSPANYIDGEVMGMGMGKRPRGAWVDSGYMEIDDVCGVEVEMTEHVVRAPPPVVRDDVEMQRWPPPPPENGVVRVQTEITIVKEDR